MKRTNSPLGSHRFRFAFALLGRCGIVLIALLSSCSKSLSDAEMRAAVKKQAESVSQAVVAGNYELIVDTMYTRAVELYGGKSTVLKAARDTQQELKSKGVFISKVTVGEPTGIWESGTQHFSVVPQMMDISGPGQLARAESYLLGISNDGGANWQFLDGDGVVRLGPKIKTLIPGLPPEMALPTIPPPVMVRSQ